MKKINRKGFTLIEVILVLAIIAIIITILAPNILSLLSENDKRSCHSLVNSIETAARTYVTNNKYDLGFTCTNEVVTFSIKTLVNAGALTLPNNNITIRKNNSEEEINIDENLVTVTFDCDTRTFNYEVGINCD